MTGRTHRALDGQIHRAMKSNIFIKLKNGLYMATSNYLQEQDKAQLLECTSHHIYQPSYLSLEYVLNKYHLLASTVPQTSIALTSITTKTNRTFTNFAGAFVYRNIKSDLYFGYEEISFRDKTYHVATKAKALFDYLYLKPEFGTRREKHLYIELFKKSSIQWENFSEKELEQFESYVWKSNSFKMMRILRAIEKYFENKKFEAWKKELLS